MRSLLSTTILIISLFTLSRSDASDGANVCNMAPKDSYALGNCNSGWAVVAADVISSAHCMFQGGVNKMPSMANNRYSAEDLLRCCPQCLSVEGDSCRGGDVRSAIYHANLFGIAREADFAERTFVYNGKSLGWTNNELYDSIKKQVCYSRFTGMGFAGDVAASSYRVIPKCSPTCPQDAAQRNSNLRFATYNPNSKTPLKDSFKKLKTDATKCKTF